MSSLTVIGAVGQASSIHLLDLRLPGGRGGSEAADKTEGGLDPEERQQVRKLQNRDREVRAHEQAHLAAAGGLAGGVSFTFVTGPDGRQYAVGGEVSIDTSAISGDPEATIQKARQIQAAANAPAQPSGRDLAVAAKASQMAQAAQLELAEEQRNEQARAFDEPEESPARGAVLDLVA